MVYIYKLTVDFKDYNKGILHTWVPCSMLNRNGITNLNSLVFLENNKHLE